MSDVQTPEYSFNDVRKAFISDKRETKAKNTIEGYKYALNRFESFLEKYDYTYMDLNRGTNISIEFRAPDDADESLRREIRDKSATPLDNKNLLDCFLIEMLNVEEYAESTVRSTFGYVRSFTKYLYQNNEIGIQHNYAKDVELGEYIDYGSTRQQEEIDGEFVAVTPEEFKLLLENAPAPATRNKVMMRVLFNCGLRRSEIVELTVDDVSSNKNLLTVPAVKSDKRKVWFGDKLRTQLRLWIDIHRGSHSTAKTSDKLFVGPNGGLSPKRVTSIVREAAENAGIQSVLYEDHSGRGRNRFGAHALRHGFAVQFIENSGGREGANIYALKELMGHHSVSVTEQYLDARDDYLKGQALSYSPDL